MKFESVSQALEALNRWEQTASAYHHAIGILELDSMTAAPKDSAEGRGKTMEILSQVTYDLAANPENGELLSYLEANLDELNPVDRRKVEVARKSYDQLSRIPANEYVEYAVMLNHAQAAWEKAKNASDYELFAPWLEKIIAFQKKFAGYYNPGMAPYDALRNEFEEGANTVMLDAFFSKLRSVIVPLLAKIMAAEPVDDSFLQKSYPIYKQRELSRYLMDTIGLPRGYCTLAESEHPFTTGFNNKDVRITTHYHENAPTFSIYSVIHEGGHALYELGCGDQYNHTILTSGTSMGIHESQSRFYENLIGRSRAFIGHVFPKIKELFPEQLEGVDAEQFYRAVNKVQPSLIRTEADELTYCLHVMVRYEIEKQLIAGTLEIKEVPAEWNRLYKEYLGVDVPDDKHGCLQDSHWSGGMIGYFPSYALGSAYGPQMLSKMMEELGDVYADVAKGDISKVTGWLKEHIHQHACFYKPGELFENCCGKFDAKYYTDYLTEKYTKLYNL